MKLKNDAGEVFDVKVQAEDGESDTKAGKVHVAKGMLLLTDGDGDVHVLHPNALTNYTKVG